MATNSIKLLTGNSHPELARAVANRLGIELTKIMVLQYSNQETSVTIGESVRDEDGTDTSQTLLLPSPPSVLSQSQSPPDI
ncbi:ribose phosphate diphosphokinase subunit prs4 [Exophiala xenobiotica]|nr:ribose phosphate diphosphokinase subunit prs4 [Exophiala xenobiotica]